MINDRQITISAGKSRKDTHWQPQTLKISELYEKLRTPARSPETLNEYLNYKKPQQDDLKDVGGYVAGLLTGPRRKGNAVSGRDVLTLDLDNIPAGGTQDILRRIDGLGCSYCVYSTRKHHPAAPRLRILLPLDRTVTADEYEPCTRRMAAYIGIELADPTTFEASRLMYWPSVCSDGEYVFTYADKPLLSADGLLATYTDWRDIQEWPQVPGAPTAPQRLAAKQGDPLTKGGIVGAFCRVYDVYRAMDELLPGIYEPVDGMPNRYTYTGGSTTGGAVVYDNGKFLFSHHATDPTSGKLVNAFDLVRLHKFEDLDDSADVKPDTPTNRLPSYTAMREFAISNSDVAALMATERFSEAMQDFEGVEPTNDAAAANWQSKLKLSSQDGFPLKTIDNIWIILENDPLLRGRFATNEFAGRGEVFGRLPWCDDTRRRFWADSDNSGAYWYFEKYYRITGNGKIDAALALHAAAHSFNEVKGFLQASTWDGTPRLDTILIDYLGAADNEYTRAVTRKAFTAAVARAMTPGVKYDYMTILSGPQGIGKSTLLSKMSKGWFNDSIRTFEGKEASELLQGVWLVEISELDAFRRTEISRVKQFLSLQADRFRAAYGRHVKEMPRCCVFFGTTNNAEYLQDKTGNRRFWPIDVGVQPAVKSVFKDLDDEIDQLWAEAAVRWRLGEPLYLNGRLEELAQAEQEDHREASPHEGLILDFLDQQIPENWSSFSQQQRLMFWGGTVAGDPPRLIDRDRVCAPEVWVECLGNDIRSMKNTDAIEINGVIALSKKWVRMKNPARFGCYKLQRGYQRSPLH